MATYGYARCSDPRSTTMSLEVQIEALRAAGCTVIRSERRSGTTLQDRTELKTLLDFLREGDTLCVTRVDRIARSVTDLMIIVRILEQKGVAEGDRAAHRYEFSRGPLAVVHARRVRRTRNQPPARTPDGVHPAHPGDRPDEAEARAHLQGSPADDPAG